MRRNSRWLCASLLLLALSPVASVTMLAAESDLADLLTLMKDLPLDSKLVTTPQAFKEHPKLGELRAKGQASCSAAYIRATMGIVNLWSTAEIR